MMKFQGWLPAIVWVWGLLMGAGFGYAIADFSATQRCNREAIEHNAAEYVCDPQTGETTFRWKKSDHAR